VKRLLVVLAACGGGGTAIDAGGDAPLEIAADAAQCFGVLERYCFAAPPEGTLILTDAVDPATCAPGFGDRCVIAARDIVVSGFTSAGDRPLVLVAARSVQIDGIFTANGTASNADCPAPSTPGATAGGPGGSFAAKGGDGGNGSADVGVAAANGPALTTLRAGCDGTGRTGGGRGGGAIALVAGERIAIQPTSLVAACGTGGGGGGAAAAPGAPGSGGGSGGMIELDAPTIQILGDVFAIGGGGGGGSNDSVGASAGVSACDVRRSSTASGGVGNGGGGVGGTTGPGGSGAPGSNGGGGGGGAGAIWTHGALQGTGQVIPVATPR